MEPALVGVTTGVMKPLLSKLTKLLDLEQEFVKLKGVRKQIEFLRDELSAMSAALEILADTEQLNQEKRVWRDTLRELAYDIEDCVDAFMARDHLDRPKGFIKGFLDKLKRLKERHEIANVIEELKKRATEVSKRHKRYNFDEPASKSSRSVDPRLPALYEEIYRLVGIGGPKKRVIELLDMEMNGSSTTKLKVVSIAGCGGLGKTTLANQVYQTIRSQFSCAAFVSVSRSPDVRKILRHIAQEVGFKDNNQDDEEQQLIDKLRKHLQDKRYFVVIDDIWDSKAWKFIKLGLPENDLGSRIITTTRSNEVASCCSSQGGTVYQMEPLSFNDSKRLLFKRAFDSEDLRYPHLGSTPDEILRKCDGLPLAIITISSMLADQHAKSKWDEVLHDIGSALARNPGAENMTTILSMSYYDIPHHLRTCLLYLSLFLEDYEIQKQCLINRWIAEGFIQEDQERNAYELGEYYFNNLINRSMIQPVDIKYDQAKACRVHDIILDFIKCKAAEENFVTSFDDAKHGCPSSEYKVRRLCVNNHVEENVTIMAGLIHSHVRSFTLFGYPVHTSLLPFTALRVLDLGYSRGIKDHHLVSIEKLLHLKYLSLRYCTITKLPEKIGELQYLQTLDVQNTQIKGLPQSIRKLERMAHLYVGWYTTFPDGTIGQLKNLEELRTYGVHSYKQAISLQQEFSKLTKLRTLKVDLDISFPDYSEGISQAQCIYNHMGTLLSSCNLHHLCITNSSDGVYPLSLDSWHPAAPCSLRKLCLKGYNFHKVPNWMGSLGNLQVLKLYIICVRPEDVEILGEIPSLLFLILSTIGGTKGRIIVRGSYRFRSLKYFSLYIRRCGTAVEFEAGSMLKLEHVKLNFAVHKVGCLNGASSLGIQHLSALSKVEVIINSARHDGQYNPAEDINDNAIRCVARAINAAAETLPNRPTIRFETQRDEECDHFERALREENQEFGGSLTEWLKIWQIEEEQTEKVTGGETEQEDGTNQEEEEVRTHEEGQEKQQEDNDGSN